MNMNLKLTSKDMKTYGDTRWELGEWRSAASNPSAPLCSDSWIHFYHNTSPELAIVLNPIHADFRNPRLFRVETSGPTKHELLKSGAARLRLVEELPVPEVSTQARVRFAIYVAQQVPHPPEWKAWAQMWLNRSDRSLEAARAAREAAAAAEATWASAAAEAATRAAEAARPGRATRAAWATREAAWAAAWAAMAAAEATSWAARSVARAAAWAAGAAAEEAARADIDFNELLKKAIDDEA